MISLMEKNNYKKEIYHEFLILLTFEVLGRVGRHYVTYGPTDHRDI